MSRIIGIDLGTTNSLAAVWEGGESHLIPNAFNEYLTPSVVSVEKNGTVYVGKVARERLVTHPESTASLFKRFMGTRKRYMLAGKAYRPEELSSLILRRLKEDAEAYLGETVEEAVISVPAYFNDMARKATRDAGRLAGLNVQKIINEPSAAALACQSIVQEEDAAYLVFDFGGGTLDVSLVECFENIIEIQAVSGDNRLGGSDFDEVIAEYFCKVNGLGLRELNDEVKGAVLASAEQVKQHLSENETAVMQVKMDEFEGTLTLSRKQLIDLAAELFNRMSIPIKRVLADAKIPGEQLEMAVLVGGSCKMPVVRQYLQYLLKDVKLTTARPDHMIALGAGVYAGIKERNSEIKDMLLTDICPFSLGIASYNEGDPENDFMSVMIERNSPLPISIEHPFYTIVDNQDKLWVRVFQGESLYTKNNLKLGDIMIHVPPAPKGEGRISIRFTYDINGLLVVDVTEKRTGKKEQLVIMNEENNILQEELDAKLKALEQLKIHPRDMEENQLLLARGEKIFRQSTEQMRAEVEAQIGYFEYLIEQQDTYKIYKWRKHLEHFLNQLEGYYQSLEMVWEKEQSFSEWYESSDDEEQDVLQEYTAWSEVKYLN